MSAKIKLIFQALIERAHKEKKYIGVVNQYFFFFSLEFKMKHN